MKQYEAVILTLKQLGGQATLGQLYIEVLKVKDCQWQTKTPFASIRRIVQTRPEIVKVRPGLWALKSYLKKLDINPEGTPDDKAAELTHTYYQGLLVNIGNMRKFNTYIPNQDKNKNFLGQPLGKVRSIQSLPQFSYPELVSRSQTIDVIWFNNRNMPHSMFEVEHSSDFQNSLLKFSDLQDFHTRFIIVSSLHRKAEFNQKIRFTAFSDIRSRVQFLNYEMLVKQYETEIINIQANFVL